MKNYVIGILSILVLVFIGISFYLWQVDKNIPVNKINEEQIIELENKIQKLQDEINNQKIIQDVNTQNITVNDGSTQKINENTIKEEKLPEGNFEVIYHDNNPNYKSLKGELYIEGYAEIRKELTLGCAVDNGYHCNDMHNYVYFHVLDYGEKNEFTELLKLDSFETKSGIQLGCFENNIIKANSDEFTKGDTKFILDSSVNNPIILYLKAEPPAMGPSECMSHAHSKIEVYQK